MLKTTTFLTFAAFALSQTTENNCQWVYFADSQYPDGACCVGGTGKAPLLSTCPGWPICTGPATTTATPEPLSCATIIPNNSDYSKNLAVATSSLAASGTNFQTTFIVGDETAAATGAGSSSGASATSEASASASSASASSSSSTGAAASLTNNNAMTGIMTVFGVMGGGMLLLAALL